MQAVEHFYFAAKLLRARAHSDKALANCDRVAFL